MEAARDIAIGEELYWCYGEEYWAYWGSRGRLGTGRGHCVGVTALDQLCCLSTDRCAFEGAVDALAVGRGIVFWLTLFDERGDGVQKPVDVVEAIWHKLLYDLLDDFISSRSSICCFSRSQARPAIDAGCSSIGNRLHRPAKSLSLVFLLRR